MLGESDGNSKLTLMKVSCILSYIVSSVLSRNLKLQLSGFLPYTFHAPFSLYHSNKTYWKSFWGNFILKIEKYSGMSILAPFASASLLSFFIDVMLLHIIPWIEVCLGYVYVWSWVGDFSLKEGVQIRISYKGKYLWNDCFNSLSFKTLTSFSMHVVSSLCHITK